MSRPASPRDAHLRDLSPRRIVAELDRHVVGQGKAKKAVAVALRDRWRRQQLPPEVAREITPKNILMVGPTGVGKTEIARRMARLVDAPFVKVEASKFTEVGYVGRDVESIARDLVEAAIRLVKDERRERVRDRAQAAAEEKLVDLLATQVDPAGFVAGPDGKERLRRELRDGKHEAREVEVEVVDERTPQISVMTPQGVEEMGIDLPGMLPNLFGGPKKKKARLPVSEARADPRRPRGRPPLRRGVGPAGGDPARGGDGDRLPRRDRQDRGARGEDGRPRRLARGGPARPPPARRGDDRQDEARERAGPTTSSSWRPARSTSPARRTSSPSCRGASRSASSSTRSPRPTSSGSSPSRSTPSRSRRRRSSPTEGIELVFAEDGLADIAKAAAETNRSLENIGARRLHTILERVLSEVSFAGPDAAGARIVVDHTAVTRAMADLVASRDLSRFVL